MSLSPGSSRGGSLQTASVTLTNAQVKTLATAPFVEVVPAPGATKAILPLYSVFVADTGAGAYTGITAYDPAVNPRNEAMYLSLDQAVNDNPVSGALPLDGLLNYAHTKILMAVGHLGGLSVWYDGSGSDSEAAGFGAYTTAGIANAALTIHLNASNVTGGNAANTLKVTVYYLLADLT